MYSRLVSLTTLFDDDECALIRLVNSLLCRLGNHKSISTCRLEHNGIRIGHLLIDEKGKEFKLSFSDMLSHEHGQCNLFCDAERACRCALREFFLAKACSFLGQPSSLDCASFLDLLAS